MTADFTAAAVLITYGALLGKTSRFQLLLVVILECIFFAINENILIDFIAIRDTGGSVVVHLFGAYFGLGVALVIQNSGDEHELDSSTYHSDLFAMIGKGLYAMRIRCILMTFLVLGAFHFMRFFLLFSLYWVFEGEGDRGKPLRSNDKKICYTH